MSSSLPPFLRPTREVSHHEAIFPHEDLKGTSHALWWPSANGDMPATVLLFIPGNPGLLGFYTLFLNAIHDKARVAGKPLAILAHSHFGHTPGMPFEGGRSCLGLLPQVAGAVEAFDALKSAYGPQTKVVVVGHSVGAWIANEVLRARSPHVDGVFLLFPTLSEIASTPNGRRLSWLFKAPFPAVISALSPLTRFLPISIIYRLFLAWPKAQVGVLKSLIYSPSAVYAALTMAHDEMITIKKLDVNLISQHHDRLYFYFAEKDDWVASQKDVIVYSLVDHPAASLKIVHDRNDIPHAFCINHGEHLASQCYEWLISGEFL